MKTYRIGQDVFTVMQNERIVRLYENGEPVMEYNKLTDEITILDDNKPESDMEEQRALMSTYIWQSHSYGQW